MLNMFVCLGFVYWRLELNYMVVNFRSKLCEKEDKFFVGIRGFGLIL
jgi:hypothetical protein